MKSPRIVWCANCDKRIAVVCGLCNACMIWKRKHGFPRPRRLWDQERIFSFCRCGDFAVIAGRCRTCYDYRWRHHGKERPRALMEGRRPLCANPNCGQPLPKGRHTKSGHCNACSKYLYRTGRQRPQELILRHAPFGYCDACGRPAHRVETIPTPGKPVTLRICSHCDDPEL